MILSFTDISPDSRIRDGYRLAFSGLSQQAAPVTNGLGRESREPPASPRWNMAVRLGHSEPLPT
jgi:hypothetical protein